PAPAPPAPGPAVAAQERQKAANLLFAAGVSVPEGLLPAPRVLTPAQVLRREELLAELEKKRKAERLLRGQKKTTGKQVRAANEQHEEISSAHEGLVRSLKETISELKTLSLT
ncbi:hypothetical protein BO94DRAFT_570628, partial [Aspergillus sclerotioniger CBS 115572]